MTWILCLLVFLIVLGALAYFAAPTWAWAVALVATVFATGVHWVLIIPILLGCAIAGIPSLRKKLVISPTMSIMKKVIPPLSSTEKAAIDAGTVWWDAEIYSGKPDWNRFANFTEAKLTEAEQAFLDGPTETLCAMVNDWQLVHKDHDLPEAAWDFIKNEGFHSLIIKKEFGGKGFSNFAHAKIVEKIATRCGNTAMTVMIPNSVGPAELLMHYGTKEQCDYYLPRLAKGIDMPCFALTSPYAGSDAGAIPDFGVVERGDYTDPRTGEKFTDVLGIRLTFEKRWITLGPIATVVGLAFKLKDPNKLLGDKEEIGITCALLPRGIKGLNQGRRHYPNNSPIMNGPISGKDVFIPVDWIIGGPEYAGKGWRMLMECLSVGRCISLPALSAAKGKLSAYTTSAYAGVRHQFGLSLSQFEGVNEALARIGGYTYQIQASQDLALSALDNGENPSVISAIIKYHSTEKSRQIVNDAMDIHGGRAVMSGPRNYLTSMYNSIPIAITVEGANILTRSMMIFGQGAFRCHRYVLEEIYAMTDSDTDRFDKAFSGHVQQTLRNQARSFVLGITQGALTNVPQDAGKMAKYYRRINRLSAAFSFAGDIAIISLGGSLKFRENLSARLGDAFSNLYIASAVLKRFAQTGSPDSDLPIAQWAVEKALFDAENALVEFIENFPLRPYAWLLKATIFPFGRRCRKPSDTLGIAVSNSMCQFGETLERLTNNMYVPTCDPNIVEEPVAALKPALDAIFATQQLEKTLRKAHRSGELTGISPSDRLDEALEKGLITAAEREQLIEARKLMRIVITVDDFDFEMDDYNHDPFDSKLFLAR